MKNVFLFSLILLVIASCQKQNSIVPETQKMGKLSLPLVTLVQGSDLVTKSADLSVDNITYEFWVKSGNAWIPAGKELYKDYTGAQDANSTTWTVSYPNQCQTCFIEVPLGMQTRVVVKVTKGIGTDAKIKFYGVYETPAEGFIHAGDQIPIISINAFEINSRLRLDVSDVAKNTNFDFVFTFTGTVKDVDYSSIVQGLSSSWIFTSSNNSRGFNSMPLASTGTAYTQTFSILGKRIAKTAPDYKLGNDMFPTSKITTVGGKTYFEIYEYFGQGSNDSKVTYSITRKSDGVAIKTNQPITASGTGNGFAINWLQAGYNFTIAISADPQALGKGCFTTTLINNTEITGTVTL